MGIKPSVAIRTSLLISLMVIVTVLSIRPQADTGTCGGASVTLPFTDVSGTNVFFCSIAEAYFSALTNGTTPTTYNPGDPVTREQMAAFITRTMDRSLQRGSRRAALDHYWTPTSSDGLTLTTVGGEPTRVKSDGADLWVTNLNSATVSRVRASDGMLLQTWTGANAAAGVVTAKGLIFVTTNSNPATLYQIDPTQPVGPVTTLPISIGPFAASISFDGARLWTANSSGSVSIVTLNPLSVSTISTGFTIPNEVLFDGSNMWLTDSGTTPGKLFKLDSNGAIIQTVTVGNLPRFPIFDGTNIWVPDQGSNAVTVVRASTGSVVATLTGNGLNAPLAAAFDGERILISNVSGDSVSLWKASDLTPLGSVGTGTGTQPFGVCSDGLNFWITLINTGKLARF